MQERFTAIKAFNTYFGKRKDKPKTAVPDPEVVPVKILNRPKAVYTESARKNGIEGIIRIAVLFRADGKTKEFLIVRGLSHGLTEQAIKAARNMEFTPKTVKGVPEDTVHFVEYVFDIY